MRSSQPLVGLKQNRSTQDEKLIELAFQTGRTSSKPSPHQHLIIDARPTANALANVAVGAGSEKMEFYPGCRKVHMNIDNIHVMRDSLERLVEGLTRIT